MASDYGDEAGSKMIDDFMRFGERMGERAMYARAAQMQRAFQNATRSAQEIAGVGSDEHERPEWAKLDMQEFQGIGDYDGIKGIIEDRLAAHGVGSTWFPDTETGKEYLLFRIADAREVWQSFDELSRETDDAAAKAAEEIREQHEKEPSRDRDDRTLDERAEDAREASATLSVISFLAANAYTACLLSLPGNPISNLTAAFSHLPSYLIGHGPLSLEAAALATGLVAACSVWCAWAWSLTHGDRPAPRRRARIRSLGHRARRP